MTSAITPPQMRGINTVLLSDGREVHLDDIATATEGQALLDDIDTSIDRIEVQIAAARDGVGSTDPDWRRRAEIALKRKRRTRPRLQQRIGELRRAERQPEPVDPEIARARQTDRRAAFINAAEVMLDHELFTEIWARAREMCPAAFSEGAAT